MAAGGRVIQLPSAVSSTVGSPPFKVSFSHDKTMAAGDRFLQDVAQRGDKREHRRPHFRVSFSF
jgi:hypothetical protein